MKQSKIESFIEASINVIIGYFIAVLSQLIIFPLVGIHVGLETNFIIGFWFALISLARSYLVRRFFNSRLYDKIKRFSSSSIKQK